MMPLISSTITPLLAPSSMAFVSPTTWKGLIRTHRSERQTRMIFEPLKLLADDNSEEETGLNDDPAKFYESNATTYNSTAKRSYSMGTTIGAQNVGEMLFNKELQRVEGGMLELVRRNDGRILEGMKLSQIILLQKIHQIMVSIDMSTKSLLIP